MNLQWSELDFVEVTIKKQTNSKYNEKKITILTPMKMIFQSVLGLKKINQFMNQMK